MEYTDIKAQFMAVIGHNFGWNLNTSLENLNVDRLFTDWAEKKAWFIEKMGGLIYECPDTIEFRLSEDSRKRKVDGFLEWIACDISEEIAWFLGENKDGIFDNKVEYTCNIPGINVGMKLCKSLKFFIDREGITDRQVALAQERLSMLIQEDKVCGKLCLSVHPLDFLSLSENQHNWRSCHALDGEYRAGNLTYMTDDCTVIAYLKSAADDVILPRFPKEVLWNNKKWRCLFFIDKSRDLIWAGRQYPFESMQALNEVNTKLFVPRNIYKDRYTRNWIHATTKLTTIDGVEYKTSIPTFYSGSRAIPMDKLVQNHKDAMHFNDLLDSSYYTPYHLEPSYISNSINYFERKDPLIIGGAAYCPICGTHALDMSESLICKDCLLEYTDYEDEEVITHCNSCGSRIIRDDDYWYNGDYYCPECYADLNIRSCDNCGERLSQDEMIEQDDGRYFCVYCHREANNQTHEHMSWIDRWFN